MSALNKAQLINEIISKILSGNSNTTAQNLRTLLNDYLDSYPNLLDGGYLFESELGYKSAITVVDGKAFLSLTQAQAIVAAAISGIDLSGLMPKAAGSGNPFTGDVYLGGNSIANIATIQDSIGQDLMQLSNLSSGVGMRGAGNFYVYMQTDLLSADRLVHWRDIDYTGVADISDITALSTVYQAFSGKGVANGYAGLDSSGYVPLSQINPSLIGITVVTGVNANGFTWSIANPTTAPALTLTLQNASGSQSGQLTSTDWTTFNNKLSTISGITAGGDLSGTYSSPTVAKINGNTIPANTAGYLYNNGSGTLSWATPSAGTVTSFSFTNGNGFTGTVSNATTTPTLSLAFVGNTSIVTLGTIATGIWQGTAIADSYISSSTNWNTAYTDRITSLTTTGSSGSATLSSNILNIPAYTLSGLGGLSAASPAYTGSLTTGTLGYTDTGILGAVQSSINGYNQFIIQNSSSGASASSDFVVNNNNSTATTYYGDFGMNSSGYSGTGSLNAANNVYLTATTVDLAIGTTTSNAIRFVVNGSATDSLVIQTTGLPLFNYDIQFASGKGIKDSNGNYLIALTGGGAANYVTISNGGTGVSPLRTATGSDTNIGQSWLNKGTGTYLFTSGANGAGSNAFTINTSTGVTILNIDNNGKMTQKESSSSWITSYTPEAITPSQAYSVLMPDGTAYTIRSTSIPITSSANLTVAGTVYKALDVQHTYNVTATGVGSYTAFNYAGTINQSTGAQVITGINISPTFTALGSTFYGFRGQAPSTPTAGSGTIWNTYMDGTAPNYFNGNTCFGTTTHTAAFITIAAATTAKTQINFISGTAPTSPNDGDMWYDGTNLKMRIGGTTKTVV